MGARTSATLTEAKRLLRAELVAKGLRNPGQIPPFVLGRLFPDSKWGPNWRREDGYVTFTDGGFAGGDPTRPELSARIYREVHAIRELLPAERYERSLEVGCGYGRLSGWIADQAGEAVAIDPNGEALERARARYPQIAFVESVAEGMPFPDDSFDLVVSWAVLQHVEPRSIEAVVEEVRRVLEDDATIVLCERTSGEPGGASWVRSAGEYEGLFEGFDLMTTRERPAEPTFEYAGSSETMVFTRGEATSAEAVEEAAAARPIPVLE